MACSCPPYVANHVGPEVTQAALAGASFRTGLFAGMVQQGRPAGQTEDRRSPQRFESHPRIVDAVSTTAAGDDTTRESLPGRLTPSTWDGEPGWMAATGGAV